MLIWIHLFAALAAILLGGINLALAKGTFRHKVMGWIWIVAMLFTTLPSFWIREINIGSLSWIHGLTAWTLISMLIAVFAIRRKKIRIHAGFMVGTMIGATIAGAFAFSPGRFISQVLGY